VKVSRPNSVQSNGLNCASCKQRTVALQNFNPENRMSRPQKIIPPIKGDFNSILASVAMGSRKGKHAAIKLAREKVGALKSPHPPKK
jgi:hypothetical protein